VKSEGKCIVGASWTHDATAMGGERDGQWNVEFMSVLVTLEESVE
jgi:hypothetical protein